MRHIRSKDGGRVVLDGRVKEQLPRAEELHRAGDFGRLPESTTDDALLACLECYAVAPIATKMSFSGCAQLTHASIGQVLDRCPLLRHLDLSNCPQMDDPSIAAILQRGGQLKSVDLSGTATTVPFITRQRGLAAVRRY